MFASMICRLQGHSVNRRRVRHDGSSFHTTCTRCHQKIVREQGGWRRDTLPERVRT